MAAGCEMVTRQQRQQTRATLTPPCAEPGSPAARTGGRTPAETEPGGGSWDRSQPEIAMARPRRSTNSHAALVRALPHVARLHRVEPFRLADEAELRAAADRFAGPAGWCAVAGWAPADVDFKLIHFATPPEAEAMQRWIAESGIETRPAPQPYRGPQLTATGGTTR
jgi:hypothetical protein